MKLRNNLLPVARSRKPRTTRARREQLLVDCVVTALRWLDVQAPGRAYGALSEGLREWENSKS